MVTNVFFATTILFMALGFFLLDECRFLIPASIRRISNAIHGRNGQPRCPRGAAAPHWLPNAYGSNRHRSRESGRAAVLNRDATVNSSTAIECSI